MSEKDERLVRQARNTDWVLIREEDAETEEGRAALHDIIMRKYYREMYSSGLK